VSNVFTKGTAPFYPVPQFLVSSGALKDLRDGAHKLYQFILFTAQQRTRVALELSNVEIREAVGLSPNTIRRARTELKEAGLIDLRQARGGRYTYLILNWLTGAPLPQPKVTIRRKQSFNAINTLGDSSSLGKFGAFLGGH
jgi:hypothetical protein